MSVVPMQEPIGSPQRTLEHHHQLQEQMLRLASRLGSTMPRSQTDGISGPKNALHVHRRGGPYVRAEVVRRLLRPLVEQEGLGRVSWWAGVSERTLFRIMEGESVLISVALADDLICGGLGDPSVWATAPGLDYLNQKGEPWTAT